MWSSESYLVTIEGIGDGLVKGIEEDRGANRMTAHLFALILGPHDELMLVSRSISHCSEDLIRMSDQLYGRYSLLSPANILYPQFKKNTTLFMYINKEQYWSYNRPLRHTTSH